MVYIYMLSISCEIALRWIPLNLIDDKSTLVQVMAWCHEATSHYQNQCWWSSMMPCGTTTWTNVDQVLWCYLAPLGHKELTLNMRGPSYLGLTRSISWLLMPWRCKEPGHQQQWYWICRICRSLSYLRKDFEYLGHINGKEWHKMKIFVYVPSEKFST